ncbi:MAG: ABC transporter permease [Firmicutes bacterium]|nr:ABC transporter permease [Candidatus Colimorpha enterica]MDD6322413.1 ABC transporter permease [Bacillota bacterium]
MTLANWIGALPGVLAQGMIWGIMAIGVFITFRILDIADLTVDGTICTGAAVCAVLLVSGVNAWAAIAIATLAGVLCGLITGILHTFFGIPAILAGILTQMILWSANLIIMGKANVALTAVSYSKLISNLDTESLVSNLILLGFVVAVAGLLYWFFGTELGVSLRSTGSNPNMSRAQGINTDLAKVLGLMISNGLVALSGALLAQYSNAADINMGKGAIVIGLAAVVVGEAVVSKISGNFIVKLFGVVVGAVIYHMIYQTVILLGMNSDLLKALSAVVVIIFLGIPYVKRKYFSKPHLKGDRKNA